ncbi:MAG: 3'(2'),5'-bisphosphate nucleotidase CysQ [Pseudomonadota bacterium]
MQETDLDLLKNAVTAASPIAEKFFKADPTIWDKGDGQGPVTEADLAIDKCLNEILISARPDYGWLSEETDDDPARLEKDTVFIVDPIDGTRAFIAGQVNFAIAIAVAHKGEVTAAVVHMPIKGVTYAAERGYGATKNEKRMAVTNTPHADGARMLASGGTFNADLWQDVPSVERHFRSSLAYRICLVAEGRFDAAAALRPTWEWDMAAGDLIMHEAGGLCTTRTGAIAQYNSKSACQDGLVIANPDLHKQLMIHLNG